MFNNYYYLIILKLNKSFLLKPNNKLTNTINKLKLILTKLIQNSFCDLKRREYKMMAIRCGVNIIIVLLVKVVTDIIVMYSRQYWS